MSNVGEGWKLCKAFTDLCPRDFPSGRGCGEKQKSIFICFLMLTNPPAPLPISGESCWVPGQAVFPGDTGSWDFSRGGSSWGSRQCFGVLCVWSQTAFISSLARAGPNVKLGNLLGGVQLQVTKSHLETVLNHVEIYHHTFKAVQRSTE